MTAPVTGRGRVTARTAGATAIPAQRGANRVADEPKKAGQRSARRAYARRDDRLRRLLGGRPVRTAAPTGRAQFVLLIMVLLAIGLVATLWFSTAAAADSYRLQDARAEALALSQQAERLHREVAGMESRRSSRAGRASWAWSPSRTPPGSSSRPTAGWGWSAEPRAAVGRPARP
ncbi:hypothetical protein BJF78_35860, partial [Pseudonocardia sp. CNS-139]